MIDAGGERWLLPCSAWPNEVAEKEEGSYNSYYFDPL
jgi:hypothetical protein